MSTTAPSVHVKITDARGRVTPALWRAALQSAGRLAAECPDATLTVEPVSVPTLRDRIRYVVRGRIYRYLRWGVLR